MPKKTKPQAECNDEDNLRFQNWFKREILKRNQIEMKMEHKNSII